VGAVWLEERRTEWRGGPGCSWEWFGGSCEARGDGRVRDGKNPRSAEDRSWYRESLGSMADLLTDEGSALIDLLGSDGQVIHPHLTSVGMGLFDHAFERQYNPGPPTFDREDPILNEASEERNFVGADSRRFRIRVAHPGPKAAGRLPSGQRFVTARWYTRGANETVLDDNRGASEITLVEGEPGVFDSPGLMLVSWEEDRDLETHCGRWGRYPSGQERRGYGASDHRLRLASIFGDMVVEYPADPAKSTRPSRLVLEPFITRDRRSLPLNLFVASTSGLDRPVSTPDQVLGTSLGRARRIYATLGMAVVTAPHPVAEAWLGAGDPRIGRVSAGQDFYYVIDARGCLGRKVRLDRFDAAKFTVFCRHFPDAGRIVRGLYVSRFDDGKFAMAYPEVDFAGQVEAGACACQAETYPDRALLAHEVGHILTNKGHEFGRVADQTNGYPQSGGHYGRPATPPDNRYIHFYNLMGGSRYRLYDVDVTEAPPHAPRVRTFNQYRDMRSSPYVRRA
jgi:hypothetical protein